MTGISEDMVDIYFQTASGQTSLQLAVLENKIDVVSNLLERPNLDVASKTTFINKHNASNPSALFLACKHGYLNIIDKLIENGADICLEENDKQTSLHAACGNNRIDIVSVLLEKVDSASKNVFVNKRDRFDRSALYLASYNGYTDIVTKLIEQSADITTNDASGMTCLHVASMSNHFGVVQVLLKSVDSALLNGFINKTDKDNRTALFFASDRGNYNIVSKLMQYRADTTVKYKYNGQTCLHVACEKMHTEVVRTLVGNIDSESKVPFINMRDNSGCTALFYAREKTGPESELVCFLIENEAV